ncbi:MAG TPA: DUF2975 domain-containing protein [Chitinophagaceae bacterium]|nr:DUF2975 domain-containing protein [Chitinophagaceae bacterium]
MKTRTERILTAMRILAWVIFIGLCIRTGVLLYSCFISLFVNPAGAKDLYMELDLSSLYNYSLQHYVIVVSMVTLISALKALIFYLVIKIFLKINFVHPFNTSMVSLIFGISYTALGLGTLALVGTSYCRWLAEKGVDFPPMDQYVGGGAEFLFFAAVIFFIAQVFKRGIEIQTENELIV